MLNQERMGHRTEFVIHRFNSKEFDEFGFYAPPVGLGRTSWKGNVMLNAGITKMWSLIDGTTGSAFSNAVATIGVGTSTTAADSTDTGLTTAAASRVFVAVEAGYPSITAQTIWFRAIFGSAVGNDAWEEFAVCNAASQAIGTCLNHAVTNQGTKAADQTWTIDVKISLD